MLHILLALAGVSVVLFLVTASRRPSAYRVERGLDVAAPPTRVYGILDDLRQFSTVLVLFGDPWGKGDPALRPTCDGPASGVGQSLAWAGNRDAGEGRMTVTESVPGQRVVIQLDFVRPMKSTSACALALSATPTGTRVTWSMVGHHNFVGKAAGIFVNLDNMLGADIEKGLGRLKLAAEGEVHAGA